VPTQDNADEYFAAEDGVLAKLTEDSQAAQESALADLHLVDAVSRVTAVADSPMSALQRLQWTGDEVLVLASARGGPLLRVFLGDMTYKLSRATPVPAIVLPRHAE